MTFRVLLVFALAFCHGLFATPGNKTFQGLLGPKGKVDFADIAKIAHSEVRADALKCLRGASGFLSNASDGKGEKEFSWAGKKGDQIGLYYVSTEGTFFFPLTGNKQASKWEKQLKKDGFLIVQFQLPEKFGPKKRAAVIQIQSNGKDGEQTTYSTIAFDDTLRPIEANWPSLKGVEVSDAEASSELTQFATQAIAHSSSLKNFEVFLPDLNPQNLAAFQANAQDKKGGGQQKVVDLYTQKVAGQDKSLVGAMVDFNTMTVEKWLKNLREACLNSKVTQIQDKAKELELVMKNVPETNAKIVTKVEDDLNRVLPILFDGLTPQNLKDPNEVQRKAIIPLLQQSIANQRTPLLRELLTKELGQNGVDPNSDKAKPTRQQGSHEGESPKNTPKK